MKKTGRIVLLILGMILLIFLIVLIAWKIINPSNGNLISSGVKREYLLYVPDNYDSSKAIPLLIDIHGFAQWPANQAEVSQWDRLADEEGFIVVHPSGTGFPKRWRVTPDPENPGAVEEELQFFQDLIAKLSQEYSIDPDRIFASGLSNGAGMSLRLACDLPDQFAAIGGVAGAYLVDLNDCPGGVPGIFFHGQEDKIVPFEGGPSERFAIPFPNIAEFVQNYAHLNGCNLEQKIILEKEHVKGVRYEGCDSETEVIFYTIADGGHTWPGGSPLPERITGKTTQEIEATQLIWDFFMEQTENR